MSDPDGRGTITDAPTAAPSINWPALVQSHRGLLQATARRYGCTPAEAEDAAQRTWLAAIRGNGGLRDHQRISGWISTIARHECIAVRKESQQQIPFADIPEDAMDGDDTFIADAVLAHDQQRRIWAAVDSLPDRERMVVRALFSSAEPSYKEIAKTLRVPIGSIGPIRARALSRLRTSLLDLAA
jgi:RNA polymerase sigma factor (sigma-70 family)